MSTPKVSVIVPVFNTEKYLKECIDSITNQTLQEIEIIIVDDGSEQECATFCDELAKNDGRIRVVHTKNQGPGLARNVGLEIAKGEYVGFIDSDDYIDSKMYESLYCVADRNCADLVMSGVSFVGGNTFSKSGDFVEKNYFEKETVFENEEIKSLILGVVGALPSEADDSRYGVSVCKNIFRRELICDKKIEFLSERKIMSEDTLFMVDYIKQSKKAVGIKGAYYRYRRNDESFSKSYKSDRFEKAIVFLTELENHISDILTEDEYRLYLNRLAQGYGRIVCSQEIVYALDNKIGFSVLKERLEKICKSKVLVDSLRKYPWYQLPKKQAAFAFAMKYKLYFLQKIMVKLRAR